MTNKFAQALKNEDSRESVSITENGARGYAKTSSRLVDFFFKVGSMRNMDDGEVSTHFAEAYAENPKRALELMFFVRDVRGGMGEKRTFKICFDWLVKNYPGDACDLVKLIPEYGSWKTFFELTDSFCKNKNVEDVAKQIFLCQWDLDFSALSNGKRNVSLLGKWAPSENASSRDSKRLANYWRNVLKMDSKHYRKALSAFRNKIKIVEAQMTAGKWSEINYNTVPARAGMLYKNAFLKHDEARRREWLDALKKGDDPQVKINTTGLTIPEMVAHYMGTRGWSSSVAIEDDPTIEAAWRDLVAKNQIPEGSPSLLPIVDGSGSMFATISRDSNVQAIHVSIGLGLFLANINTKAWKGMVMEYGSNPSFYQVPTGASLREQIKIALQHDDCGSTNVQAVYDLILKTVQNNGLTQADIPELITFSDMEFNQAMTNFTDGGKLFEEIAFKWNMFGFKLPKQTFWNINSRTGTVPMTENDLGVILLSGYSQAILGMVLSRKLDPLAALLEKLDSKRYDPVRKALA